MEVVNVSYLGSDGQYQTYSPSDIALINTSLITPNFGTPADYIEYFIKDQTGIVLSSNYYADQYGIGSDINPIIGTTNVLNLDPESDAKRAGFNRGVINVKYNFLTRWLLSSPDPAQNFWIKEISTSRTEIKVARQDLSNTQLANAFSEFNTALAADTYYPDFYLNFGADVLVIAVNAVYVEENGIGYIIFKLYEPLPLQFDTKSTFWVVTDAANPAEFNVSINVIPEAIKDYTQLRGPNFKVDIKDKVGQTTPFYNYASLLSTSVSSSFQQLQSIIQEKGIDINVDYSNFSNFVRFSSATNRLYNFTHKIQLIESASAGIASNNTATAKVILQEQIDSITTNFDGYEYYLYFESASTAWPKQNSSTPYELYSVTSSQVINWLGSPEITPTATTMSMYWSSSYFDDQNQNLLLSSAPAYITEDPNNQPYFLFLNMVGQQYDNIWIYLKDITNLYAGNNNPFKGISLDEVADAIRNMGVQLYTNTSISDNIYYSLLGLNQTGSSLPVTSSAYSTIVFSSSSLYPLAGQPYLTASLSLPPFGEELINRFVTSFVTGSPDVTSSFATLPGSQITGEIYKRIYHNMPYLLKTKGTKRGLQALITAYGIPEDILNIKEYGGYNIFEKAGIQEISPSKIITGSVLTISSSLLSPYTTIQYYQNNTDKSSNDLEIGFSPADSINASITSSGYVTSSTEPGYFNIMQYIGAPALQYSSSYTPLVELADTYFNAEYTSRYNVWDFIRVIKYYNNSLFKMLKDFVPARTSPSTGIVIQSHMLERNKYPRHEPTFTQLSGSVQIDMVTVSGSDGGSVIGNTYYVEAIPIQYQSNSIYLGNSPGIVYVSSSNNVQKYTGEFSGSVITTDFNTFTQDEVSSYIYPWTSSIPAATGNVIFTTYSVSPTINNITGAVISQRFLDLDYGANQTVPTNYGLITKSLQETITIGNVLQSQQPYSQYAQLQDYNYFLPSTVAIRYSGSYLQGQAYNTYSIGDLSYGNEPVINYYSDKLGFFTQIATSSFIPGKVNATLGYLADVSGGLFELNQNNKNWVDLQNIFVAGTTTTVKQFDNKKYTNQVSTDGVKSIYNSGYNYTPQLYFQTGSDSKIFFESLGAADTGANFLASLTGTPNYNIAGVTSPNYPVTNITDPVLRAGSIYKVFDTATPSTYFAPGNASNFPSYSAPQAGQRIFTVNLGVNFQFTDPSASLTSGSYSFGAYLDGTNLIGNLQRVNFTSSYTEGGTTPGSIIIDTTTENRSDVGWDLLYAGETYTGPFTINGGTPVYGDATSTLVTDFYAWEFRGVPYSGLLVTSMSGDPIPGIDVVGGPTATVLESIQSAQSGGAPIRVSTSTQTISYTTPAISVGVNQPVIFKLLQEGMSSANYTASLTSNSSLTVSTVAVGLGGYPYATTGSGNFIESMSNLPGNYSSITFTSDLAQYVDSQFVPYFVSGSTTYSSSLYLNYGDVNVPFSPQFGDKVIMIDSAGISQDLDVYSFSDRTIIVVGEILSNWVLDPKEVETFLLLRRYKDEQNVILTFNKANGPTSYGFIIPETINPGVIANINTLQAAVQSQLLSNQASTGTNVITP